MTAMLEKKIIIQKKFKLKYLGRSNMISGTWFIGKKKVGYADWPWPDITEAELFEHGVLHIILLDNSHITRFWFFFLKHPVGIQCFVFLFCFVLSFVFLGTHLRHMEVPKLGVVSKLHLPVYATAKPDQSYAATCSNARSLTHRMRPGIEPTTSWILVRFLTC